MQRLKIPEKLQTEIVLSSRRRCCFCFGLNRDLDIKRGQIAHLDKNSKNNKIDNLAFLCMDHHDEHDSKTSQSKSFLLSEVKAYREELVKYWETPEFSTHKDIILASIQDVSLAPHFWKNYFLAQVPNGWDLVQEYPTGEIWGSMIAMTEDLELKNEDWIRYQILFESSLPDVVKKLESEIILWGDYFTDNYKHKLQMSLRKLSQSALIYKTLQYHNMKVNFLKNILKETLMDLKEICKDARDQQSQILDPEEPKAL